MTYEEQVQVIVDLMAAGEWRAGRSHRDLSDAWGVGISAVKTRAAEASRIVRRAVDSEAVTGTILAHIDTILVMALERRRPNLGAAIGAMQLQAQLLGLVTQRHEITSGGVVAASDPEQQADMYEAAARALRSGKEGA